MLRENKRKDAAGAGGEKRGSQVSSREDEERTSGYGAEGCAPGDTCGGDNRSTRRVAIIDSRKVRRSKASDAYYSILIFSLSLFPTIPHIFYYYFSRSFLIFFLSSVSQLQLEKERRKRTLIFAILMFYRQQLILMKGK